MVQSHYSILIILIPLLTALLVVIAGMWWNRFDYWLATIAMVATFLCSIRVATRVVTSGEPLRYYLGNWPPPFGIEYVVDHLSAFMIVIVAFIALNVVIFSRNSVEQELPEKTNPFYCILLLLVAGLMGILMTGDLFNLYVFLEVSSLTAYGLIGLGGKRASLSGFRYLILGTIGASLYLLGVGFIYIITGSLNIADIATRLPDLYQTKVVPVAFALMILGIGIKLAIFPLHSWLPDAYTYAPSSVSAFVAPTMTKVAAYMMIRIMFTVFEPSFALETIHMADLLPWMGVIAMVVGSIYAIRQTDLKRMLAYSSVAQVGYIVLGIGLANRLGLTGGLLHIVNHALMKGCLFLVAGAVIYRIGDRNISSLRVIYRKMPYTMAAFTIAAFSMIGIPPTCGFFSKLYLILGSIDAKQWTFVFVILLSSILNVIYFINVIRIIYFNPEQECLNDESSETTVVNINDIEEVPWSMRAPILVTALSILFIGFFNGAIIENLIAPIIPTGF